MQGWGHIIDESDPWKSTKSINGTNWTFYGAQADQVRSAKQKAKMRVRAQLKM